MSSLPQKSPHVNTRFHRNCDAARKAGFNLSFPANLPTVRVNGVHVTRHAFDTASEHVLLAFLDSTFGKPGRVEFYQPETAAV